MSKRSDDLDRGLTEEIQFHLEQEIQKQIRLGHSPEEARRRAHVRFGGVEPLKERTRDEFRPALVQDFLRDLRIGFRTLFRTPGFAAVVILTIGLGAGAATAVFSVVNAVLLQPLPFPRSHEVVRLYQIDSEGQRRGNVSEPNFLDWQASARSFAVMARMSYWGLVPVVGGSEPTLAPATLVSREFFDLFGVKPAMGRTFAPNEQTENGQPAVIVSHAFWRRWLGGTPEFGARTLRMSDRVFAVVGVMPEGFDYPNGTALWMARELNGPDPERTAHNFQAVGRLREGASLEAARAELSTISRELKKIHGDRTWMSDATAVPLLEQLTTASRPALQMLFGAALLLLVIANMNVSSLLLARAAGRRHEFAIQLAMGAGRARIRRQLLAETVVLCVAGTAVGAAVAGWAVRALVALGPRGTPRLSDAHVDWTALAFAFGVSLASAVALGLLTTIGAREAQLSSVLSTSPRTGTAGKRSLFARQSLVVVQVALTVVLLAGTGLLARSFIRLLAVDPGFRLDDALVVDLTLTNGGTDFRVRRIAQVDDLLKRIETLPGVTDAGVTTGFPLGGGNYSSGQFLEMTSPDELPDGDAVRRLGAAVQQRRGMADYRIVSGSYFQAMGIPLLRGRVFDDTDDISAPHVAVISKSLAEARWPGRDPIGRFIQFGNMDGDRRGFRVVGIVGDVRELRLEEPPEPTVYASYRQRPNPLWRVSLIARGPAPEALSPTVQRILREANPDLPFQVRTVEQAFDATLADRRFSLLLISIFGVSALVLATLGLYALIAFVTQQRTREIGIRMALGATTGQVVTLVVRRGVLLSAAGCLGGLGAGLALGKAVDGMLYGVTANDPAVLGGMLGLTLAAALAASLLPARRATRVSPVNSLRG